MSQADQLINARLTQAVENLMKSTVDPQLRAATKSEFGHFQTNIALRLAKELGRDPRTIAAEILAVLDVSDLCRTPTQAGAGFINFTLRPEYLAHYINNLDERLGVALVGRPQRIVLDYSQPNVAKEMHVGHLRSTVIGDALGRMLEFAGHQVIRQNHIGDWGTQFGMLIEQLLDEQLSAADLDLAQLSALYRRSRRQFDTKPEFADRARARVVALQAGDAQTRTIWRRLVDISIDAFQATYRRLDIRLTRADVMGESAYNEDLPVLVDELTATGMLTESEGASCVFNPGFVGRDGQPLPVIVRKRDGGFGYSATDLAAIRHRITTLAADRLIYVVDVRQSLHFQQVLAVARRAGWLPESVPAEHVHFGSVLDENGQPFKSRDGQIASLRGLLDIAEQEAAALLADRDLADRDLADRDLTDRDLTDRGCGGAELARAVGLGAIKYADLSAGRSRDYVFAVQRMVALDGNTGPYLQYAHARLCSLLRRGGTGPWTVTVLSEPAERQLAFVLSRFPAAVAETLQTLEPHRLCGYLYRLASAFSAFYQSCPVTQEGVPPQIRESRLAVCGAAHRTLALGLDLLGIAAPETM